MNFDAFKSTLSQSDVPDVNDYLKSLWYVAKDDWSMAHLIARDIEDETGYWIHGHLHRAKGDEMNAEYWYEKANRPYNTSTPCEEEWEEIVNAVLGLKQ